MGWPIESDYFGAVQSPHICFSDADLRAGHVSTNALGLPKSITGAFASVYQVQCPNANKWAVRCFLRDIPDQQRRYSAISTHLNLAKLPYTTGFEYAPRGILINGNWYPILKMAWLDGVPLDVFIEQNLSRPQLIQSLAKQWIEMMAALGKAEVAHGDLQHGNILICNGALKLIDYDGMYVPSLKGMHSNEQGHPNYQHPRRSGSDFNAHLDNFAAWVIFISLSAFAIDPNLWRTLNCGDDNLLFRKADFDRPAASKVFRTLDASGEPRLQSLSSQLRSLLYLPIDDLPALDGMVVQPARKPTISGVPAWLSDHVPHETPEPLEKAVSEPISLVTGADWIFDHLVTEAPKTAIQPAITIGNDRRVFYSLYGFAIIVTATIVAMTHVAWFALLGLAISVLSSFTYLAKRYHSFKIVDEKTRLFAKIAETHRGVAHLERSFQTVNGERVRTGEPLAALDHKYRSVPHRLTLALQELDARLDISVAGNATDLRKIDIEETEQLQRLEAHTQDERNVLLRKKATLRADWDKEAHSLLADMRRQHILNTLNSYTIRQADLRGIGPGLMDALQLYGIVTAADIDYRIEAVKGIGPAKQATLRSWRMSVEAYANHTAPADLPPLVASQIALKYQAQLQSIERQIAASASVLTRDREAVIGRYSIARHKLVQREQSYRRSAQKDAEQLRASSVLEKEQLAKAFEIEKTQLNGIRKNLDGKLMGLSQQMFKNRTDLHQLQREYDRHKGITFKEYVFRVIGLKRSA